MIASPHNPDGRANKAFAFYIGDWEDRPSDTLIESKLKGMYQNKPVAVIHILPANPPQNNYGNYVVIEDDSHRAYTPKDFFDGALGNKYVRDLIYQALSLQDELVIEVPKGVENLITDGLDERLRVTSGLPLLEKLVCN